MYISLRDIKYSFLEGKRYREWIRGIRYSENIRIVAGADKSWDEKKYFVFTPIHMPRYVIYTMESIDTSGEKGIKIKQCKEVF